MDNTTSGLPISQVDSNFGADGKSFGLPSFAPPSTQAAMVSISACVSRASFSTCPKCGSACQGGISRVTTFSLMDFAHGRTSLKLRTENGAMSSGLWQSAQLLNRIGATSLVKVTTFAGGLAFVDESEKKAAAAKQTKLMA